MKKIILIVLFIILSFLAYNYFAYPNFRQIEEVLSKNQEEANQNNWRDTYSNDVQKNQKVISEFINKVAKAKCYNNPFFLPKEIDKHTAQRLAKILSDSSSYIWGETTVAYNRKLLFLDDQDNIIAITEIDEENEFIDTYPFRRTYKWGKLSKKGRKEFFAAIDN
ncbi:hypothetical protein GOQ30_09510 [Flavobacterium sp. TP390]|uniref:Uncharacterized protein n=1 Tax=Flavobacterium profundi TaxID=1774945 RepID=A0A6I4IIH2_9FLAO|nr:hypothetical protein [Flavobacterium profundi]MVO09394.1 hypothetical protein [Flavobacterium profundi]